VTSGSGPWDEKFLPALRLAQPVLTGRHAFDSNERDLHPVTKDLTAALPADVQVRIGCLDVSRGNYPLVYAVIDEAIRCHQRALTASSR
jgi:hypothetical protein